MHIAVVSDAWYPQVNGVVRTLATVGAELVRLGHTVSVVSPDRFRSIPCPSYPEIRLALLPGRRVARLLDDLAPDAIHVATEGPLGLATRRYCRRRRLPFTTSLHTKFPEYVNARIGIPVSWGYAFLRWFHSAAATTMVATATLRAELTAKGFGNMSLWSRGVDLELFRPRDKAFIDAPRPISLYVGRVAVEKNVEAFLALDLDGSKVVVGDGPQLATLRRKYRDVRFVGAKSGEELAQYYAAADVFVFPSRTDTFGNVLLESLAAGVPVAAFPVTGPADVVNGHAVGVLDDDLGKAVRSALSISGADCRSYAETFSWRASAEQFLENLIGVN